MNPYLFVYGTLKRGGTYALNRMVSGPVYLGAGSVFGKLYDLGPYPGLVEIPGRESRVDGELWRLKHPREDLRVLDEYEQVDQGLYRRVEKEVDRGEDGRTLAWVYVYGGVIE